MNLTPSLRWMSSHGWAMEYSVFEGLVGILERHAAGERLDAAAIAAAMKRDPGAIDSREAEMRFEGDTAIIPVRGVMARYADTVNGACQDRGRSAQSLQSDLLAAAGTLGIKRVVLAIDSPGGEVSGTAETGRLIAQLVAEGTEVIAHIDGLGASAAYWLASQCSQVIAAAPTVIVGSIGVMTGYRDPADPKVKIITSKPAKGPGDAKTANLQSMVDDLHRMFAGAVQVGRNLTAEQLAKVDTAEIWTAERAMGLGLVDAIAPLADVLARKVKTPVASAANPAAPAAIEGTTVAITTKQLGALIAKHPTHAQIIGQRAEAGDDEPAIASAIAGAELASAQGQIGTLTARITELTTAHAAAITAEQAKVTAAEARATAAEAKLTKHLNHVGATDVGPSQGSKTITGKTLTQAQFDELTPSAKSEFFAAGGKIETATTQAQA